MKQQTDLRISEAPIDDLFYPKHLKDRELPLRSQQVISVTTGVVHVHFSVG